LLIEFASASVTILKMKRDKASFNDICVVFATIRNFLITITVPD